ncbi:S-layer homology domain-containing protein [Alteribacillus persepolensis]|uniref:S-layer homology domain-containing protein n=1 Tax=Alteribacillus persepolensis TaxID=568899 RepID=A0A1G8ASX2_9BACI|nr:S-layer homology domain-containing protein [Alteribacillus persepolensis]SDH24009.1 S-layer homology domain-containing protein [Alteribacillus persepolensis]
MSYNPKSYRKFLAGSVSAAMAATTFGAVAPVDVETADAAEAFPDVSNDYWASESIQRLADNSIIGGFEDGTYGPGLEIKRGQVAAMLVAAFDLEVDENASAPFEDLTDESYFTPYAAAVKEAGLIKGREDNTVFAAGMDLSRQQMATILVRAFDLEHRDDVDAVVNDLDEANASHKENIEILAQYGITNTGDGNFRPKETVTRAQFAVFLDRALDLEQDIANVSSVQAVDSTTVEVSLDSQVENVQADDFAFDPELAVEEAEVIAPADSEASEDAEGSVVRLTTEEQTGNQEYALSYKGEATDESITGIAPELAVENAAAVTPTSVEVTFNQEVEEFDRNDVVLEADNGEREFVSDVTLAEDGQSATLDLYNQLSDETSYDVTVETGEESVTGSFDYIVGDIAEIEVSDQAIKAGEETDIEYKVFTTTGLDVTETEDVTFHSTGDISADGSVKLADGESIFATIEAGDVESDRFKITGNDSEATELVDYTVGAASWDDDEFESDQQIALGQTGELNVLFHDQYGEQVSNDTTFETLTPGVLIVDKQNGTLTPRSEGTADVRVTNGDVSEIITIDVVAEPELNGIVLDNEKAEDGSLSINPNVNESTTLDVQLQDQHGDDFSQEEELTVEVDGESIEADSEVTTNADGSAAITLNTVAEEFGTSTVTVSNEDGSISESIDVNVVEAGEVEDYELSGLTDLDLNGENNEDTQATTTLELFPVDENGVEVDGAVEAEWTVENEDGEEVDTYTGTAAELGVGGDLDLEGESEGTYTVKAEIGSLEVVNTTFELVDTTEETEYVASQTQDEVELTYDEEVNEVLQDAFEVTEEGSSKAVDIDGFDYDSDNVSVVDNDGSVDEDGTATLYVDTITVDDDNEVDVDFSIDVNVDQTIANVSDQEELSAALEDGSVKTINLDGETEFDAFAVTRDDVTINGNGADIAVGDIQGYGTAAGIAVDASGVVINDVTISGDGSGNGIIGSGEDVEFTVNNADVSDVTTGIYANAAQESDAALTAENNTFTNVEAGIGGTENATIDVTNNTFKDAGEGIGLGGGVTVTGADDDEFATYLEDENTFEDVDTEVKNYR